MDIYDEVKSGKAEVPGSPALELELEYVKSGASKSSSVKSGSSQSSTGRAKRKTIDVPINRWTPPPIPRNSSCPCGSGKKFKKCCGKS